MKQYVYLSFDPCATQLSGYVSVWLIVSIATENLLPLS